MQYLQVGATDQLAGNARAASSFKSEMPERLRFLALAARHGDYTEVSFIAHHIASRCERISAMQEYHLAMAVADAASNGLPGLNEAIAALLEGVNALISSQEGFLAV